MKAIDIIEKLLTSGAFIYEGHRYFLEKGKRNWKVMREPVSRIGKAVPHIYFSL